MSSNPVVRWKVVLDLRASKLDVFIVLLLFLFFFFQIAWNLLHLLSYHDGSGNNIEQ